MGVSISIEPNDLKWLQDLPGNFKDGLYAGVKEAMFFAEAEAKKSFGKRTPDIPCAGLGSCALPAGDMVPVGPGLPDQRLSAGISDPPSSPLCS